jgi:hypothetical protein
MHGLDFHSPVVPPLVPEDTELHFFNPLTCYVLHALSQGQSMVKLAIDPTKGQTIKSLMSARFPGIPATNNQPTCRVLSFHTIAYVQALCMHCLTYHAPKKPLQNRTSAFHKTFLHDIAEEGKEDENYEILRKRLTEFHCTMLGVDGATGEAGDRRLSGKRKSKGFDEPPAVGDADPPGQDPLPNAQEPPAAAAAPAPDPAAAGAAAASEEPPTPPPPAGKRGGRAAGR